MASDAKTRLVDFLIERSFDPVLKAREDGRSDAEKRRLEDVKRRTRSEIERFKGYGSARDVVVNFRRDLNSEPARKVHRELKSLGLPTINDIREEFERKAEQLGVRP